MAQLSVWASLPGGSGPNYITVDPSGNIYTQNISNTTVSKITPGGTVTAVWVSPAMGIRGITSDISGRIFVSSNTLGGCYVYSSTGASLGTISTGVGPQGIAADNLGNVYVANYSGGTVSKINSSLVVAANYTISGSNGPFCICTDPSGNVYTANYSLNTVSKISAGGILTASFATLPAGAGPHGVCSDPSGNIYVSNNLNNTVVKLDPSTGAIVNTWTVGTAPLGICADSHGNIYVANSVSNSVSVINSAGTLSATWTTTDPVQISINSATQTLYITNQSASTISTNSSILPVTLTSFTAQYSNNVVGLEWTSQSTTDLGYFEVERSVGGSNFIPIGKVNFQLNINAPINYRFTDQSPVMGQNVYRLAIVDLNGNSSYSETRTMVISTSGQAATLSVWPSPIHVGQQLQINCSSFQGASKTKVFNSGGQEVWEGSLLFQDGLAHLPTNGLTSGVYVIMANSGNKQITTKFVIQ